MNTLGQSSPILRLREFADWAKANGLCGSLYDFEKRCGLSNRYISNSIANGRGSIGAEKLGMIVKVFPMLNLRWVCNGEGRMLADDCNTDYREAYEAAMKQIEALNRIISKK
ncbi:MAG: hypothetical protein HDS27_03550 [Bacteroides sp.]|nr:hypothetical protein [Bacteroides sp.]